MCKQTARESPLSWSFPTTTALPPLSFPSSYTTNSPIHSDHTNPRYAYPHLYINTTTITQFPPPQPSLFFFLLFSCPSHLLSSSILFFFSSSSRSQLRSRILLLRSHLACAYLDNSDSASELFIKLNNLRSREFHPGFDALIWRDWVQISAISLLKSSETRPWCNNTTPSRQYLSHCVFALNLSLPLAICIHFVSTIPAI